MIRTSHVISVVAVALALAGCVTTPIADGPASSAGSIPAVGTAAPDFALPCATGAPIRLTESRGFWIVLHFHAAADLPECVCQTTFHTQAIEGLRSVGDALVLLVSDLPTETLTDRKQKHEAPGFLLSAADRGVIERWGLWDDSPDDLGRRGRVRHATFLIDPAGVIAERWIDDEPVGHGDRVRAALARHLAASAGPR